MGAGCAGLAIAVRNRGEAFGQPTFPDRLALAAAIALVAYIVLSVFTVPQIPPQSGRGRGCRHLRLASQRETKTRRPCRHVLAVGLPANDYFISSEIRRPRRSSYLRLLLQHRAVRRHVVVPPAGRHWLRILPFHCWLALSALCVRRCWPTAAPTSLMIFVFARRAGWCWRTCMLGPALFAAGVGMLCWTNVVRLGTGLEFGHRINMTSRDLIYLSRFDAPFDHEPFWPAAKELFGGLFFANYLNGFQDNLEGLALLQSATPRMRHFYTKTYDLSFLIAVLACWLTAALSTGKSRRPQNLHCPLGEEWDEGTIRPSVSSRMKLAWAIEGWDERFRVVRLAAAWSVLAFLPLFAFYLHYCVLSSMYLCDFAPAFAAAIAGGITAITAMPKERQKFDWILSAALICLIALWSLGEIALAGRLFPPTPVFSQAQVLKAMERKATEPLQLPDHYDLKIGPAKTGIRNNGNGWEQTTGETGATVVLFVSDPEKLVLEVSPAEGKTPTQEDYAAIRAKVGLAFLQLESSENTDHGRRLTFKAPERLADRRGIQPIFLSFVRTQHFRDDRSPFKLDRVEWTNHPQGESAISTDFPVN